MMAKTTTAIGVQSKRLYQASEIDDHARYAEMTAEPLVDANDTPLAAVRKKGSPHFRRLDKGTPLRQLGKAERSDRHKKTIDVILKGLQICGRDISIFTNVFDEDDGKNPSEQTLFALGTSSDFRWYSENSIIFDDFTYIQPDISGKDISRMAPTRGRPGVIIEVIDTHFPEPETFEKLMALSRSSYHVYFLVMGAYPVDHAQKMYKYPIRNDVPFRMRTAWALLNGELVRNGVARTLKSSTPELRAREALDILIRAKR
jgi:hypothetical protein